MSSSSSRAFCLWSLVRASEAWSFLFLPYFFFLFSVWTGQLREVHNSTANEACTLCRVAPLRSKRWWVEKQREHVQYKDSDGTPKRKRWPHQGGRQATRMQPIWEKPFPHVLTCSLREGLVDDILNFARVDGQTITCANCSRVLMGVMSNLSQMVTTGPMGLAFSWRMDAGPVVP